MAPSSARKETRRIGSYLWFSKYHYSTTDRSAIANHAPKSPVSQILTSRRIVCHLTLLYCSFLFI